MSLVARSSRGEHGLAERLRERRAVGICTSHGRQCARSADRNPGGRCGCPLVVQACRGQWRALPAGASLDEAKRALAKLRGERSGPPGPQSARREGAWRVSEHPWQGARLRARGARSTNCCSARASCSRCSGLTSISSAAGCASHGTSGGLRSNTSARKLRQMLVSPNMCSCRWSRDRRAGARGERMSRRGRPPSRRRAPLPWRPNAA